MSTYLNKYTFLTVILSTLFFYSATYAGGGWPKKKGKYYVKVAGWYVESNTHFTDEGKSGAPNTTAGLFNLNVYAEYGVSDKLTAIAYIPFFARSYNNELIIDGNTSEQFPGEAINGIGDTQLGVKYGLYKNDKISLAASYTIDLPLGETGGGVQGLLANGDGE